MAPLSFPLALQHPFPDAVEGKESFVPFTLGSASFPAGGMIPSRHTCDGADISPQLAWTDIPAGTKSLVLIVDDPDAPDPAAPKMTWVHWVLYNLPASAQGLPEGVTPGNLPPGTRQGMNDWQRIGYGGPCPPIGRHRYVHKLFALAVVLPELKQPTRSRVEQAMQGHVLGRSELVGYYQRRR